MLKNQPYHLWRRPCSALRPIVLALAGAGLAASPSTAMAQTQPTAASAPGSTGPCRVFTVQGVEAGQRELTVDCHGRGLMLGPVSAFTASGNDALGATFIDARLGNERRILVITVQDDGLPLLEDLSGEIALAAGRGPMSTLQGVDIDFTAFANSGQIAVHGRAEDNGSGKSAGIDIGQQIAAERARHH